MSGGGSGGGGSTQTVQKADPWAGQQPYLTRGFQEAQKTFLDSPPPQYYQGNTTVPYSPETNTALQLRTMRALNGSPVQGAANDQLMGTLRGDYLTGGAGFNAAVDSASRKILPQVNSAFERAGRTGSGLAATAQTQAISDSFADQYGKERENQLRGMLFAPTVAAQDYMDIDQLAGAGAQLEGQQQNNLSDIVNRFNYGQNINQDQLGKYMAMIQGNYGETKTSTGPGASSNTGAGMLGGALGGLSMASTLGASMSPAAGAGALMGPWGLAAGAGAGMLLGGGFF